MNEMKDKIRTALDEARILVLGAQVLIGFQYSWVFQKNFEQLPELSRNVTLASLVLLLLSLGFMMSPAAYHQIVERGGESPDALSFVTTIAGIALLPFALGGGGDMYVAVQRAAGPTAGVIAAVAAVVLALFLWYGIEMLQRRAQGSGGTKEAKGMGKEDDKDPAKQEWDEPTPVKDKVQFVLTETRVVLPGAQALLGFQFVTVLTEAFEKLPAVLKYIHLGSLFATAISIMMLMAPAAFHRLAERGESTERLHRFASGMVLGAMSFLALGLAGEFYVVAQQISKSESFALVASILVLLFFYGLWFGYSLLKRGEKGEGGQEEEGRPPSAGGKESRPAGQG